MSSEIRAGIAGGAGYTGGETLRLLLQHPRVRVAFVHSSSHAGEPVTTVHSDLLGMDDLRFSAEISEDIDVLFLCLGHGQSQKFLQDNHVPAGIKIIDLSQDFRLSSPQERPFVYGLTEAFREQIAAAQAVANPGCFATCIQLGLLPLAAAGALPADVHISAITGSTGAGQGLSRTSHFSWRSGNIAVYKPFQHQHLGEIRRTLASLQPGYEGALHFVPYRGAFPRGIFASQYLKTSLSAEQAEQLFNEYYRTSPFVHLSANNPDMKQVVNTNNAVLHVEKHGDHLLILSAIDNLLKGASGQAVQNMNVMFGLPEDAGLQLKAVVF